MGRNSRRRPTGARRATFAAVALILGGGGLVAANVYASASETWGGGASQSGTDQVKSATVTIDCPDVGQKLTDVPNAAKQNVDTELSTLDQQITEAYDRLASTRQAQSDDANYVQNEILGPLKDNRTAVIDRIKADYQRAGATAPSAIDGMAACTGMAADQGRPPAGGQNDAGGPQPNDNGGPNAGQQGDGGQAVSGPVASDFVDITTVQPNVGKPAPQAGASTGEFVTKCGVNANGKHNTDNVIVAPGVKNGAHHLHDYVGNQSNDAFATNDTFAAAETSCENQGDKSSYYWPVVRVQDGTQDFDQDADGGGKEGNVGRILVAKQADIKFVGSPTGEVVAMPRFLRIITGDAKAFTNGPANANAHWSCTGFEDKVQLTDKYPICPQGSQVVRSFAFQSCWDGQNIDSANHRTHVAFADANGDCQSGFKAIPQLTMRLVYDVPRPTIDNGQVKNGYAVDGFPEQLHKPITDHDDFINVMTDELMDQVVDCINEGRQCGGDVDDQPPATPTASAEPSFGGDGGNALGNGGGNQAQQPSEGVPGTAPAGTPGAEGAGRGAQVDHGGATPKVYSTPKSARNDESAAPQSASEGDGTGQAPGSGQAPSTGDDTVSAAAPAASQAVGGGDTSSVPPVQTESQAVTGGLAETGVQLWPAAIGAVLVIMGLLLLRRIGRRSV
ncbi:DUF1996 domain-containing protein [Streptomyces chiangmaiensis]|uniref:DUF1996 domain-containing protein n=1 Tax=Streptomyces chiangmaiensis TaxID=766497 RepID=A0ABU7FFA3_9ACTN|nr:DUF1996 domain-containing protein [Streptomyces chiangmaiensis]MED7822816.1 DUF1996 domain-containing protein [Streptomyces chiangmaiensis]